MKKANILILAVATGMILAGCNQKPAETNKTPDNSSSVNGTVKVMENTSENVSGSVSLTDDKTKATATTDTKVMAGDEEKAMAEAKKAMESAEAQNKAAMEAANKAMEESKKAMETK